jgi:hypothetical protein
VGTVSMRRKRLAQFGHSGSFAGTFTIQRHGFYACLAVVKIKPGLGDNGIGKVGLVEYLQTRALTMLAQLPDHGITARFRRACIYDFDYYIDEFHRFGGFSARRGHMTGEPLYGHLRRII